MVEQWSFKPCVAGSIPPVPIYEGDEMKVYVITSGEYSDYCIQTVALSREKAEQICAMMNSQKRYYSDAAIIEEYDTDDIVCDSAEDVVLCYTAEFSYKTLECLYWSEPFYSFPRNKIKKRHGRNGFEIHITATFSKDVTKDKVRKIMKDRVAKWKAEREGL